MDAGMTMARFNLSHGTRKQNDRMIRKFADARKLRPQRTVAMVLDLRGREIKLCERQEENREEGCGIYYEMGEVAHIKCDGYLSGMSTHDNLQIDNAELPKAVRPGDEVSFNEGALKCVVLDVEPTSIKIQFKQAGYLLPGGKMNIPGNRLGTMPVLKSEDKDDIIRVAIKNNFDYICVPNITSVKDV